MKLGIRIYIKIVKKFTEVNARAQTALPKDRLGGDETFCSV